MESNREIVQEFPIWFNLRNVECSYLLQAVEKGIKWRIKSNDHSCLVVNIKEVGILLNKWTKLGEFTDKVQIYRQVQLGASGCKSKIEREFFSSKSKDSAYLHKRIQCNVLHKRILHNLLGKHQTINHCIWNCSWLLLKVLVFCFSKIFCGWKSCYLQILMPQKWF